MLPQNLLTPPSGISSGAPAIDSQLPSGVLRDTAVYLSVIRDLWSIENEWRKFQQRAACTPFQSFDWLINWQACVGNRKGVQPAIVMGRDAYGEISFILPLAIECIFGLRRLVFLGRELCDYNAPLLAPGFTLSESPENWWKAITDAIKQTLDCRYDLVFLDKMPESVENLPNPLCALKTSPSPSRGYRTSLGTNWDDFYMAKRSSHARRADGRKLRRLQAMGDIRFATAQTGNEIRETLNVLFSQKSRSFARMGVPNLFTEPGYSDFFMSTAISAPGLVHVSRLYVGSECVAANLGLLFDRSYFSVLISHDDGPSHPHSPGKLHQHHLMRFAMAEGCERFDFTIGDEPFKRDWADCVLQLHHHVAAASLLGKAVALWTVGGLKTKRAIKQTPRLGRFAVRLRAFAMRPRSAIASLMPSASGSPARGATANKKVELTMVDGHRR